MNEFSNNQNHSVFSPPASTPLPIASQSSVPNGSPNSMWNIDEQRHHQIQQQANNNNNNNNKFSSNQINTNESSRVSHDGANGHPPTALDRQQNNNTSEAGVVITPSTGPSSDAINSSSIDPQKQKVQDLYIRSNTEAESTAKEAIRLYNLAEASKQKYEILYKDADVNTKSAKTKEEKDEAARKRATANAAREEAAQAQQSASTMFSKVLQLLKENAKMISESRLPKLPQPNQDAIMEIIKRGKMFSSLPPPLYTRREKAMADAKRRDQMPFPRNVLCFFRAFSFCDHRTLLASSQVCKMWRSVLKSNETWRTVAMTYDTTLSEHSGPVNALAKVGTFIFSGSADGKLKAWDVNTWECKKTLNLNSYVPTRATEHSSTDPSGHHSTQIQPLHQIKFTPVSVTALAVHEHTLLIGLDSGKVMCRNIFETKTPNKPESEVLQGHDGAIKSILCDTERKLIFTGSADSRIGCWDLTTKMQRKMMKRHTAMVSCLAISNGYLFSGSWDHNVVAWNLATLEPHTILGEGTPYGDYPHSKHTDKVTAMTTHGNRLYTSGWDCFIKVWDTQYLSLITQVFINPVGMCWNLTIRELNNKAYLMASVRENDIDIMDLQSLKLLSSMNLHRWAYRTEAHKDRVNALIALEDGRIVTGSHDWTLKVWCHIGSSKKTKPPALPPAVPAVTTNSSSSAATATTTANTTAASTTPAASTQPQQQTQVSNVSTSSPAQSPSSVPNPPLPDASPPNVTRDITTNNAMEEDSNNKTETKNQNENQNSDGTVGQPTNISKNEVIPDTVNSQDLSSSTTDEENKDQTDTATATNAELDTGLQPSASASADSQDSTADNIWKDQTSGEEENELNGHQSSDENANNNNENSNTDGFDDGESKMIVDTNDSSDNANNNKVDNDIGFNPSMLDTPMNGHMGRRSSEAFSFGEGNTAPSSPFSALGGVAVAANGGESDIQNGLKRSHSDLEANDAPNKSDNADNEFSLDGDEDNNIGDDDNDDRKRQRLN